MLIGRLHPLMVHLPIGLLIGVAALEVVHARARGPARAGRGLLLGLAALGACAAAFSGWRLGLLDGRTGEAFRWHRALGIATAIGSVLTALAHAKSSGGENAGWLKLYRGLLAITLGCMSVGAHFGGELTHGAGYLREALGLAQAPEREPVVDVGASTTAEVAAPGAARSDFEAHVAPILSARCASCHGERRQKGDLALHTVEAIRAGGESGPVVVAGSAASSAMIRRVRLPADDDDHMPPKDKPQPSADEIALLERWIDAGAPFEGEVRGLLDGLDAKALEERGQTEPQPTTPGEGAQRMGMVDPLARPIESSVLEALGRRLVAWQVAEDRPQDLRVDCAGLADRAADGELAEVLRPAAAWIVDLDLSRCQAGREALEACRGMPRLERLNLYATRVKAADLGVLTGHAALRELNLAGTQIGDAALETLLALPRLERLEGWESGLGEQALARLRRERPGLAIAQGEDGPREPLESEPELVLTEFVDPAAAAAAQDTALMKPSNERCPVSGKAIDLAIVTVEGARVIGFCCEKCQAEYRADPARFASALGP